MRRRSRNKVVCYFLVLQLILVSYLYFSGTSDYFFTRSFDEEFDYPLNVNIRPLVKDLISGRKSDVSPINYYPYKFLTNVGTCDPMEKVDLFIAVKSALIHFQRREAIRQTYGQKNVVPGKIVKLLFFLGTSKSLESQMKIDTEIEIYRDIVQIDFLDNYYNNTIKTMMTFRWLYEYCSSVDFYMFTDDDMYISVLNLFNYIQPKENKSRLSKATEDMDRDKDIYLGMVRNESPLRYTWDKWRISLKDYPWDKWPPYVPAGAFVLSNKTLKELYIGSHFVKHFIFDDIFLSIIAKKLDIKPIHSNRFSIKYKIPYDKERYREVIASHGYNDPKELVEAWSDFHA